MRFHTRHLDVDDHLWLRVVKPQWRHPLDMTYAQEHGGRWNPPGSWPTLYLNHDLATARAHIARLLESSPVTLEDLSSDAFQLVAVALPESLVIDVVSDDGVRSADLPPSYPFSGDGGVIAHAPCQEIAAEAYRDGADGVEARSAAKQADPRATTELGWWPRGEHLPRQVGRRIPFGAWRDPGTGDAATLFARTP